MATPIKNQHIEFSGEDQTIIKGEGGKALRNALIQKASLTFSELAQKTNVIVRPEEVSVDDEGRVVISNKELKSALVELIRSSPNPDEDHFFDTNCQCNPK